eukprot:1293872-Rhodomonas_salina.1
MSSILPHEEDAHEDKERGKRSVTHESMSAPESEGEREEAGPVAAEMEGVELAVHFERLRDRLRARSLDRVVVQAQRLQPVGQGQNLRCARSDAEHTAPRYARMILRTHLPTWDGGSRLSLWAGGGGRV